MHVSLCFVLQDQSPCRKEGQGEESKKTMRTSTGGVEPSLLAQEGLVLHCIYPRQHMLFHLWLSSVHLLALSFDAATDCLSRIGRRGCGLGSLLTLCAEELSGDVDGLAADDDDLLAIEELLGDGAGKATEEMALAVDDDL